jgi:hypothetical protein
MWSKDGKYIYFYLKRTALNFPRGSQRHSKLNQIALDSFEKFFEIKKIDELFIE